MLPHLFSLVAFLYSNALPIGLKYLPHPASPIPIEEASVSFINYLIVIFMFRII